jgi:hypothetical protein
MTSSAPRVWFITGASDETVEEERGGGPVGGGLNRGGASPG